MKRKITALVLAAVLCLTLTSCGPKKSCKPYRNESEGFADGFNYKTEEEQTDNFICYKTPEGETRLFCLNRTKVPIYDTDGLCDPEPGNLYKIKYDVQHISGGIAGKHDAYFLCVYSFEKIEAGNAFENGVIDCGSWDSSLKTQGIMSCYDSIIVSAADGGYDLYAAGKEKQHYDEVRNLKIPVTFDGKDAGRELQLNILCNKDQTDEYIMQHIKEGKAGDGSFIFLDSNKEKETDSIAKAAAPDGWQFNTCKLYFEGDTPERSRRLITDEELSSKTADELQLPQD